MKLKCLKSILQSRSSLLPSYCINCKFLSHSFVSLEPPNGIQDGDQTQSSDALVGVVDSPPPYEAPPPYPGPQDSSVGMYTLFSRCLSDSIRGCDPTSVCMSVCNAKFWMMRNRLKYGFLTITAPAHPHTAPAHSQCCPCPPSSDY